MAERFNFVDLCRKLGKLHDEGLHVILEPLDDEPSLVLLPIRAEVLQRRLEP